MGESAAWALADEELGPRLDQVWAAEQTLAAQRLALIAQIDRRSPATLEGARSTAVWLRHRLHLDPGAATRMVSLARALDDTLPATAQALADAVINQDQARTIAWSMTELPTDIGVETRDKAEQTLIGFAAQFAPAPLARLGERILEHVAPEVAERHEREQLQRAEQKAWRERSFTLSPHGPGRIRLSGWLDTESAATVSAALEPLCSPAAARTVTDTGGAGDERTPAQRRADALVQICHLALAGDTLPDHGGARPQVMVLMPFEPWREHTETALGRLDNGQKVTPQTLRRMCCDADLTPVVLGGDGQVLDLGRTRRLFTGAIRKALIVRDGGCAFPGCDRPAAWCEGHHVQPWQSGGHTSVDGGVMLCRPHHRLLHEGDWQVRIAADRLPEFIPPSYVDPERTPQRNQYWRRT